MRTVRLPDGGEIPVIGQGTWRFGEACGIVPSLDAGNDPSDAVDDADGVGDAAQSTPP